MNLPLDLMNLLAVAVRDLIWYKNDVLTFFTSNGVPESVMLEIRSQINDPTVKIVKCLLQKLLKRGAEGEKICKKLFTQIYYWKDLHSIPAERKDKAISSLKEFQKAYKTYEDQLAYQVKKEEDMHKSRIERMGKITLDHEKLRSFRQEFDIVFAMHDAQERGNRFEKLMNDIFDYYCERSEGPFKRHGEQVDGLFYFDKHFYYVEVRWRKQKASAADVSVLRDRAKQAYGGDTKALFVSFEGFSEECQDSLRGSTDERVILMDGYDLRCVLDCTIAFDILLSEKQIDIIKNRRSFVSALDIMKKQANPNL